MSVMIGTCIQNLKPKMSASDVALKVKSFRTLLKSKRLSESDIPTFDSYEEWEAEVNREGSVARLVDECCASINLNQIGRGELSMLLMIKGTSKNTIKGKKGDVTQDKLSWENKEEKGGSVSFAIPKGPVGSIHNQLIENISIIKRTLLDYFRDHPVTVEYLKTFKVDDKITEFSPKRFKSLENVLQMLREHATDFKGHTLLSDLIASGFNVKGLARSLSKEILRSYTGGVVIWTKKKKYRLFKTDDVDKFVVKDLTVGNIKLKVIHD